MNTTYNQAYEMARQITMGMDLDAAVQILGMAARHPITLEQAQALDADGQVEVLVDAMSAVADAIITVSNVSDVGGWFDQVVPQRIVADAETIRQCQDAMWGGR